MFLIKTYHFAGSYSSASYYFASVKCAASFNYKAAASIRHNKRFSNDANSGI
jgi:YHS domain-containing protein